MPQYYARGIGIHLKRYDLATDSRESASQIPENPIEHDGYRTRFVGPLEDMPLFLVAVERDRMETSSPVQGLELVVDLTKATKTCRTFGGYRDLKIDVFLNGDLVACRFRAAMAPAPAIEVFSGRRVGKREERPWVLSMKPNLERKPDEPTKSQQWIDIGRGLRNHALYRGTDDNGRIPYTAEYLLSLSNLPYENVSTNHTQVFPSIIDVIISYGEGHKPEQAYISEPEPMKDAAYKIENNGLSEDHYQPGFLAVSKTGQSTKNEAQTYKTTKPIRATTPPPNKPINHCSFERSPFKSTFHIVGNVNEGTAMVSPERKKHLEQAKLKRSREKPSLNDLSAGQHIEKMQDEPTMAPIPVTPCKRRQSAAEFQEETSRLKRARLEGIETETSPSAVSKAKQMDKAKNSQQGDQLPVEAERYPTTTSVARFSTPASALTRFGLSSKPKSQKLKCQGDLDNMDGDDSAATKRFDSGAALPAHNTAEDVTNKNDKEMKASLPQTTHTKEKSKTQTISQSRTVAKKAPRNPTANVTTTAQPTPIASLVKPSQKVRNRTPARSVNTRSSTTTQKFQPSVKEVDNDSLWPPRSSRGCAVTYMDANLCGLSQREYIEALSGDGKSVPYLSNVVKKERKGNFQEKGIVCGVRYVIF